MKKYLDENLTANERAEALIEELTVEEAAGQLVYNSPAIPRLNIPEYNWWNEGLHGVARSGTATMFPQPIGIAAAFDVDLTKRIAQIIALEARAKYNSYKKYGDEDIYKGLTLWSPNINIFRDPRWGRGHETYGEDPFLTSQMGMAYVKGLQGDSKVITAAACAKHFAVHSGPEAVRHEFDSVVSEKDLEETYLPAFEALVKETGVEGVMGAYNLVNGEPACASEFLMSKLKEWGFNGYFVSDCGAIADFHRNHVVTKTSAQSAAMALKAGCDLNCGCAYANILEALYKGYITEQDIRTACKHLMRTRIRLGMFDKSEYNAVDYSVVSCKEHKKVSLQCAEKSMVLLKNNGILPLDKSKLKTIGVIGPNANSRAALEGNYCGTADRYVTLLEGIQNSFEGRVLYAEGCHLYKDRIAGNANAGDRLSEAQAVAALSDVVVLCLVLDATLEGEEGDAGNEFASGDKNDLMLPESQRLLIDKILETKTPVVIACAAGSSINIEQNVDALLHIWYSGSEGGTALANILFGDVSPSGKLPVTFYESDENLPDFTDYSMNNRTYRYAKNNVLYPFGFGLTYSKIICRNIEYKNHTALVTAENVSNRKAEDIIQLYIKGSSKESVPNHSLCGFKRICLDAGEKKTFEIPVIDKSFTEVNENGKRERFSDKFILYAGVCQPDKLSQKLTQTKCVSTEIIMK